MYLIRTGAVGVYLIRGGAVGVRGGLLIAVGVVVALGFEVTVGLFSATRSSICSNPRAVSFSVTPPHGQLSVVQW